MNFLGCFSRGACALTVLIVGLGLPAFGALRVADKGKSDYRIIVAANASPSERYAAEELQAYLAKLTGATLPLVTDAEKPESREIVVGDTSRSSLLKKKIDLGTLGSDGFVLRTEGSRLFIVGGKPRGTLYGVYTLLEEQLGVRWFTPELEHVPKTSRLSLGSMNERRVPALEYREVFWTEMMRNADFAARHRLNGHHYALQEKHGGRQAVYQPFVHSFDALIPPDLFKEHPEYFPLINGKRTGGYVQRCLSNPEVTRLATAKVREWIKANPAATVISVSQNDTANYCQCEACKSLDDAEGTPCASLLRFVNAIAQDIEQDHPRVRIDTLAYQYTRKPPKTLRPRANVIIRLCSIECCFAHPLASCHSEANRRFRADVAAWQPVAPLLYVWDYTPNFAHYQLPFPNFAALQPNVQFFVRHGVKGLFEQGNYSPGGFGENGPLRAYLLAKLLWNPDTDLEKHRDEFLAAYYGPAAGMVHSYLDLLELQVADPGRHAYIYDPPSAGYLSSAFIKYANEILGRAEQQAGSEVIRQRVEVMRLPVWYVQLAANQVTGDARTDLVKKFVEVAKRAGISHISEGQALADWARKVGVAY